MKGFGEQTVVGHTWEGLIPRKKSIQRWTSYLLLGAQTVKNPPAMRETWVRSLGREDPLEEGMATHSSILTWRIPWTEEPGGLQSMGSQRVGHDWVTHFLSLFPLRIFGNYCGRTDSRKWWKRLRKWQSSARLSWQSLDQTVGPEGETRRWGWVPEWTGSLARRHLPTPKWLAVLSRPPGGSSESTKGG